ncbi:hypothetical protein HYR69_00430 [Candidatus Sumerlaeota bacterium]|nr:hypothetical protein [Candidatus Sumerlaeota bacterium]
MLAYKGFTSLRLERKGILPALILAAGVVFQPAGMMAQEKGEKPIGEMTLHSAGKPVKPIYKSNIEKEIGGIKSKVDKMAAEVKGAKINAEKDGVEQMLGGAISLDRHRAEIAGLVDKLTLCKAAMENAFKEQEGAGTATADDKAKFEKCTQHCDKLLAGLNSMHYSASILGTATRKQYILDGWDKHKKAMEEVEALMNECPTVVHEAMACCKTPAKGGAHEEHGKDKKAK